MKWVPDFDRVYCMCGCSSKSRGWNLTMTARDATFACTSLTRVLWRVDA